MPKMGRTEKLNTDPCSKYRGASLFLFLFENYFSKQTICVLNIQIISFFPKSLGGLGANLKIYKNQQPNL